MSGVAEGTQSLEGQWRDFVSSQLPDLLYMIATSIHFPDLDAERTQCQARKS